MLQQGEGQHPNPGKQGSRQSRTVPSASVSLIFKDFSGCLFQARFNHINTLNIPMVKNND